MKRPSRPNPITLIVERVQEIYEELNRRPVERNCTRLTECCQFHLTGRTPHLTKGEAIVAAKAWRASGRKSFEPIDDAACPFLDSATARCRIYEARPFGCRTHFCAAAGGPYSRNDVIDLIRKLEVIDSELNGSGPLILSEAIDQVWREV